MLASFFELLPQAEHGERTAMRRLEARLVRVDWERLEETCKQLVIFASLWLLGTRALDCLGLETRWTPFE